MVASLQDWNKTRKPKLSGAKVTYLYRPDNKPDELIMVVVFEDKTSYDANADDPEQDRWYSSFRENLRADPEWEDGEIILG